MASVVERDFQLRRVLLKKMTTKMISMLDGSLPPVTSGL